MNTLNSHQLLFHISLYIHVREEHIESSQKIVEYFNFVIAYRVSNFQTSVHAVFHDKPLPELNPSPCVSIGIYGRFSIHLRSVSKATLYNIASTK